MALLPNTKMIGQAKFRQEIATAGIGAIYGTTSPLESCEHLVDLDRRTEVEI